MKPSHKPVSVEDYINQCPEKVRPILHKIRQIIKDNAPQATETIGYGMPAYKRGEYVVFFAAQKHHVGFYPTSSPIIVFKKELTPFKTSKGAIQFRLDQPIPYDLIGKITRYRIRQVMEK